MVGFLLARPSAMLALTLLRSRAAGLGGVLQGRGPSLSEVPHLLREVGVLGGVLRLVLGHLRGLYVDELGALFDVHAPRVLRPEARVRALQLRGGPLRGQPLAQRLRGGGHLQLDIDALLLRQLAHAQRGILFLVGVAFGLGGAQRVVAEVVAQEFCEVLLLVELLLLLLFLVIGEGLDGADFLVAELLEVEAVLEALVEGLQVLVVAGAR